MYRVTTILFLLIPLAFAGCRIDDDEDEVMNTPVISSITPDSGPLGTQVKIVGQKFKSSGVTTVAFNGVSAVVNSVSDTVIIATVPILCGTGPVKVFNGDESGIGPVFTYTYTVTVSTFCGDGNPGFVDGGAQVARFNGPAGLAMDDNGNIYVADELNHRIRRISPNGFVTSIAGNGLAGHFDATPAASKFNHPTGVSYDRITGYVYVADKMNHCIRQVRFNGVSTVAGVPGGGGYVNGTASLARFKEPYDVQVYTEDGDLYIADAGNHCIRKYDDTGVVSTFSGSDSPGQLDGSASGARYNAPVSITIDTTGYFYVTDVVNHNLRQVDLFGDVITVAGSGAAGFADGSGPLAQFDNPTAIAITNGVGLLCDKLNHRIRGISVGGNTVSTIAGNGTAGLQDGSGAQSLFNYPSGIVTNGDGIYYISDTGNNVIRKVQLQ